MPFILWLSVTGTIYLWKPQIEAWQALDLDIKVSDGGPGHMAVPCIASGISELTPEEVAAIPKKDLP